MNFRAFAADVLRPASSARPCPASAHALSAQGRPAPGNRWIAVHLALLLGAAWPMASLAETPPAPSEADDGNGAIMVTARRREEDVQTVPAAISVVGADTLARTYTVNLGQLSQLVPTLNYSSPNPRNTAYTIRGLGSSVVSISQANDGLEPGVGFYVDQVYHARPSTAAFDFTDIEQVEVLRGPQGTLFGKNTTAGAINITTKKPGFDFSAEAEVSAGELGFVQAKAAVTGPLAPGLLAVRLSGLLTRRDGVISNIRLGRTQNNLDNKALRGQLLFTPADNFSLRLIGDWASFKGECCTQVYVNVAPTLKPAAQQYTALAASQSYRPASTNPYDRVTDIDALLGVDTSEGGVSGIAEWNAGSATITSVTAWRFWKWNVDNDRDYIGIPIQMTQRVPSRHDQYSQELRIASNAPGPIEYVAGLYYLHQKITGHPTSIYGPLATYWLLPAGRPADLLDGYGSTGDTRFSATSYGIFGEVTWRPLPRLAITGGLRYTYEEKDGVYDATTFGGLATSNAGQISDKNSILRAQHYSAHIGDGSASGRANIAYELTPHIMAYASYARGQKSGGINMSGLPVYPAGVPGHASGDPVLSAAVVRPEKNVNWEGGVKAKALNGALTLNVDAFYTRVTDFQANVVDTVAPAALRSYLANIPRVRVKGLEMDAALRLGTRLSIRLAGAYSDGKYASYPKGPCPIEQIGSGTAACDLSGKGLPGLPKWSGSAGGEYALPLPIGTVAGTFFTRADVSAKTKIFGEATDSAYTVIPGYALVNASLGYRTPKWEIAVFARNLFDRNYLQNVTVQTGNSGLILGTPSEPRIIGATLRARI